MHGEKAMGRGLLVAAFDFSTAHTDEFLPIATPTERHGQEVWAAVSTALKSRDKGASGLLFVSYSTFRKAGLVHAPICRDGGEAWTPQPFIAIRFPLASLCAGMATFRGHPRRGAVIRLDGNPGFGRVGFDGSSVKSAVAVHSSR